MRSPAATKPKVPTTPLRSVTEVRRPAAPYPNARTVAPCATCVSLLAAIVATKQAATSAFKQSLQCLKMTTPESFHLTGDPRIRQPFVLKCNLTLAHTLRRKPDIHPGPPILPVKPRRPPNLRRALTKHPIRKPPAPQFCIHKSLKCALRRHPHRNTGSHRERPITLSPRMP